MIRTLEELREFEDSCIKIPQNNNISNYIFTQDIDCGSGEVLQPQNDADCIRAGCIGKKQDINECYGANFDDIIRQFVDEKNFIALKNKFVLPIPDRGSCLFLSIVESIVRDNYHKLNRTFDFEKIQDLSNSPKVTYGFENNYFQNEATKLRNCVVDFVVQNWDNYFGMFIDTYTKEEYGSNPDTYARSMRHPNTYGDQPEIIAISTLLNINIHILNISHDVKSITYNKIVPNSDLIKDSTLCNQYNNSLIDVYIVYINNNHYFALVNNIY